MMRKIEVTDDLLYEYYPRVEEQKLDNLPKENEIEYEFSELFNKKMKQLIKESNRSKFINHMYKYSKKISIIVIAFIISIFTLTMTVEAFREKLFDIIKEVYEEFTIYQFRTKDGKVIEDSGFKLPKYIPSGLKEVDRIEYDDEILITYSDGNSYIRCNVFKVSDGNLYIDTENADVSKVMINGVEADYIVKKDDYKLVWEDGNNYYILLLDYLEPDKEKLDKGELIKIAESIK